MPFIVATYVYACSLRAAHALRSDQDFRSHQWGPRSLVCARQTPIDMSENLLAHMSAESPLNICPNFSEVISEVSEAYDNFSKYPPFCPIMSQCVGQRGSPNYFCYWNAHIFVTQGIMPCFRTLEQLFKIPPLSAQICHSTGGILIFLLLRSPCKISEPYDNPLWDNEQ